MAILGLRTVFLRSFHQPDALRAERGLCKKTIFCIAPLSPTMGYFLEAGAALRPRRACERSIRALWELDME